MSVDNTGHSPSTAGVDDAQARVIFCDAVVDWALRRAEEAHAREALEESLRWLLVAARTASRFGGSRLVIPSLEKLLREPGQTLASVDVRATIDDGSAMADRRPGWLHVMSEAHTVGGHTALVRRWITFDPSDATHSVVLTFQDRCIVPELADAAAGRGGDVIPLGDIDRLIDRANRLRALIAGAGVIVFHTHQWDVVAAAACTYEEGPPVLFLNHADHEFWVGASIADALIHTRRSGLEYAERHRGGRQHLYLPVPIPAPPARTAEEQQSARLAARAALDLPPDAAVALTIGTPPKYTPVPGVDFFECARRILDRVPGGALIAVGPGPHEPLVARLSTDTDGRFKALGIRHDLPLFFDAADVYIEGFPFGSLTALLEAAAAGLAVVRAPVPCPPPFTSDGEALTTLPQPASFDAYVTTCVQLLTVADLRRAAAHEISAAVRRVHVGGAWASALAELQAAIPRRGVAAAWAPPAPAKPALAERWAHFMAIVSGSEPMAYAKAMATELGLELVGDWRLTADLLAVRRHAGAYSCRCIDSISPPGFPWLDDVIRKA
jgi:glycosyltransferase involved in cell wall biosynthesis